MLHIIIANVNAVLKSLQPMEQTPTAARSTQEFEDSIVVSIIIILWLVYNINGFTV